MSSDEYLNVLLETILPLRRKLAAHDLYSRLRTREDICTFMSHHIFAVWDFMSLLKSLQRSLTCVEVPWVPRGSAHTRRMINEIVLQEESDEIGGVPTGHFELYMLAMQQIGADTGPIETLVDLLQNGADRDHALRGCGISWAAMDFVETTFHFIDSGKPHVVAAAFTFGREDSIPAMFRSITQAIEARTDASNLLAVYLERHLELDEEDHGPMAVAMLRDLCGDSPVRWQEATDAACQALQARLRFWTGISQDLQSTAAAVDANAACVLTDDDVFAGAAHAIAIAHVPELVV